MICTPDEHLADLAAQIKARRIALSFTQKAAAERSGVSYRTWRRMEGEGRASIHDLVRAAIALRCEEGLVDLFPQPVASSMDDLLARQNQAPKRTRERVRP